MYSWIICHIPLPTLCSGPQDNILTDMNQLYCSWSKFTYFSSQGFQVIIYQQDKSIFLLKRAPLSFQFMRPLNLSTTCFNTTHNMWNGCTLEQCTLPALPRCKAVLCKWVPGLAIHLGRKSVPNHEIIILIFT